MQGGRPSVGTFGNCESYETGICWSASRARVRCIVCRYEMVRSAVDSISRWLRSKVDLQKRHSWVTRVLQPEIDNDLGLQQAIRE